MNSQQLREHRRDNFRQSLLLILSMAAVLGAVGYALGGQTGVWYAVMLAGVSAVVGPSLSPRLVLQMYRARLLAPQEAPALHELFAALAERAQLAHAPRLYYVPTRMLNAFAVGTNRNAAVAVTDGLLRTMAPREMAGVLAHELSHIRYQDTRLMALGDVFSRLTSFLSQIGQLLLLLSLPAVLFGAPFISLWALLVLVFAPVAATLLQLALSRSREFNADMGAVELTGDPMGLAAALRKLERAQLGPWWQRMLVPYRVREPAVLRTHPATEERIERLMRLVGEAAVPPAAPEPAVSLPAARRMAPQLLSRVTAGPRWHASELWY